jgi:hypothetical protein
MGIRWSGPYSAATGKCGDMKCIETVKGQGTVRAHSGERQKVSYELYIFPGGGSRTPSIKATHERAALRNKDSRNSHSFLVYP